MVDDPGRSGRVVNHALAPLPGVYALDPVHTFVEFSAQHRIVGRVRGRFGTAAGAVTIGEQLEMSSVEAVIDTASITTLTKARDEDLRSARFFDVARFPQMTFRSEAVLEMPRGEWLVTGRLTIGEVSRPVDLLVRYHGAVVDPSGDDRLGFHVTGAVTRAEFELTADLEDESGNVAVRNDVTFAIDAEAVRHRL
jgi:polyisoprenoid-binding protein YceI